MSQALRNLYLSGVANSQRQANHNPTENSSLEGTDISNTRPNISIPPIETDSAPHLGRPPSYDSLYGEELDSDADADSDDVNMASSDSESDSDDDDDQPPEQFRMKQPVRLTINAPRRVHGTGNYIPVSSPPAIDAARISHAIVAALQRAGVATAAADPAVADPVGANPTPAAQRFLVRGLEVTVNCGLTVIGDRNVLGFSSARSRPGQTGAAAAAGATAAAGRPQTQAGQQQRQGQGQGPTPARVPTRTPAQAPVPAPAQATAQATAQAPVLGNGGGQTHAQAYEQAVRVATFHAQAHARELVIARLANAKRKADDGTELATPQPPPKRATVTDERESSSP